MVSTGAWIGIVIGVALFLGIVGGFIGFFVARKIFWKTNSWKSPNNQKHD